MSKLELKLSPENVKAIFGDADECAVVLRQWVANEVAARYLKPLVNDEMLQGIFAQVEHARRTELLSALKDVGINAGSYGPQILSKEIKDQIRTVVRDTAAEDIQRAVNESFESLREDTENAVNRRIDYWMESRLNAAISKAVAAALKEKFT